MRGLAWPTRAAWSAYLRYGVSVEVAFIVSYVGCNWLAAQRAARARVFFDWELSIPFVPGMLWVYASIAVLLVLPLFLLDAREMPRLGRRMLLGTGVAALSFVVWPAELGFSRAADAAGYARAFDILYAIDLPHNLIPSLHIVYCGLLLLALGEAASTRARYAYAAWMLLITISVLLVHQHHLIDIASGLALVWLCARVVPAGAHAPPSIAPSPAAPTFTTGVSA